MLHLVLFCTGAALSMVAGISAAGMIAGFTGLSDGRSVMAIASGMIAVGVLILSTWLLRREGSTTAALGLTGPRRVTECAFGLLTGIALYLAITLAQSASVSASWQYQGLAGTMAALAWFVPLAAMVLAEELVFRGVGLRTLRQLYGDWPAMLITALFFGAYHLVGSGDWAMGAFFSFLTSAAGGLVFAWMAVRSGGLALPFGLHLGGNWVQANIAVMSPVDGPTMVTGLWRIPVSSSEAERLTAPDLLPRLPYFVAVACAVGLTWWFLRARDTRSLPVS